MAEPTELMVNYLASKNIEYDDGIIGEILNAILKKTKPSDMVEEVSKIFPATRNIIGHHIVAANKAGLISKENGEEIGIEETLSFKDPTGKTNQKYHFSKEMHEIMEKVDGELNEEEREERDAFFKKIMPYIGDPFVMWSLLQCDDTKLKLFIKDMKRHDKEWPVTLKDLKTLQEICNQEAEFMGHLMGSE